MARVHFQPKKRYSFGRSYAADSIGLAKRCERFATLPIGCEITYKWEKGSLGRVVNHDHSKGRVITDKGGSHSTLDIEVFVPNKK